MRRLATIEDVGEAAVYLASAAGRNVTGSVLHVDGGYHVMG
jgi:enoyl-[acyl-carrier protein] reductase I